MSTEVPGDHGTDGDHGTNGDGINGDHGTQASATSLPIPVARLSDPHFQEAVNYPERTERIIAVTFFLGIVAFGTFGAAYWQNWRPWTLGLSFGAGLFFIGFGITAWGKYLMPQGPFVEERHTLASSERERQAMAAAVVERTGVVVKRRRVLVGLLGGGMGIFTIVLLFPVIRSLGPLPKKTLAQTNWRKGSLLVDFDGNPIHRDSMQPGGLVTVFPSGYENNTQDQAIDQTVLIRAQTGNLVTERGRETWAPEGYVAYSKLCTHLACPVGLYEQELKLLVCPCHQSMFNIEDGAVPQFGPAPRPLPQLPLYFDSDGYLHSQAGYDQPVGMGYWERP